MAKSEFRQRVEDAIQQRHSKVHPWSEAWVSGGLNRELLGEWVKQHFHYVSHFPWWCGTVYANAPDQAVREFLLENMMEEEGMVGDGGEFPVVKHTDLLLDFAEHCGMSRKEVEDAQLNGELLPETLGLQSWCYRMSHKPYYEAVAGLLVGLGTRLGGGCTSGHGICGMGLGAKDSIVATLVFMGTAMATVFVTHHVIGGAGQ